VDGVVVGSLLVLLLLALGLAGVHGIGRVG